MSKYFARCDNDVELDSTIRDTVVEDGSKTSMAMYLQGQEQLNLLRTLIVEQGVMMDELKSMKTLVEKTSELYETYNEIVKAAEVYSELSKGVNRVEGKINDLMEYICESANLDRELRRVDPKLSDDAISLVRLHQAKAKGISHDNPTEFNKHISLAWDYILCCVEVCN